MRTFFATCGALALMIPVGLLQSENTNAQDGFRRGNRRTIQALTRVQRYNACNSRRPQSRNISLCGVENCGVAGCDPLVASGSCRSGNCGLSGCSTCQKSRRDFCDSPRFDGPRFGNARNQLAAPRFDQRRQNKDSRLDDRSRNRKPDLRPDDRLAPTDPPRRQLSDRATVQRREIQWRTDIRAARRESSETGLPILMKFSAKWCGPCKLMKAETFTDPRLAEMINTCFTPVEVDTDQNEQLARQLRIESVPTTMVISADGDIVERREGFQSAAQLTGAIARFCQRPAERPIVRNEPRPRSGP
jgi:thiol-disulfide isomerase/thioredoxin